MVEQKLNKKIELIKPKQISMQGKAPKVYDGEQLVYSVINFSKKIII